MANSISGNCGVAGAYVTAFGIATNTFGYTTADGSGNYTISGLGSDVYEVFPSKGQGLIVYQFSPDVSRQTIVLSDITGVNFTAVVFTPPNPGVWTKKYPSVIPSSSSAGVQPGTVMYEGNAQILSGNVFKMWYYDGADSCYAESTDGITWSKYSGNPIIVDFIWISVFKHAGTYYLYGSGTGGGAISLYTSPDGITWAPQGTVLSVGSAGAWDSGFLYQLNVIEVDGLGTWHALYTGGTNITTPTGVTRQYCLGHATSPDGKVWTKDTVNNPVWFNGSAADQISKIGGTYYAWFNYAPYFEHQSYALPTDIYRISSPDYTHWGNLVPSLSRTLAPDGPGEAYLLSQTSGATMVEVNGSTYYYYNNTLNGANPENAPGALNLAIAPMTMAQIVAGNEGVTGVLVNTFVAAASIAGVTSLSAPAFYAKAGNTIIVHVRPNTKTVTSIQDTAGNDANYTPVSTSFSGIAGAGRFYLLNNCVGNAANIVTVNLSGSDAYVGMMVWQISNVPAAGLSLDVDASHNTTSGGVSGQPFFSASFNTQYPLEIVLAAAYQGTGTVAPSGAGMVNDGSASTFAGAGEHLVYTAPQTNQTVSATFLGNASATLYAAAFGAGATVSGNAGVAGATVSYSGTASGSVTADGSGNYSITGLANGSYTVAPSKTGYTFSPTSASETVAGADITGVDFTATQILVATPTFSPVAGTYTGVQTVTVSDTDHALTGFAMYWNTTGSPTISDTPIANGGTIAVSASETIYVLAVATGYVNSAIGSAAYVLNLGPVGAGYSVPDCRKAPSGPNTGVVVQGTIQYTGQTSCDKLMPRVDSRAAGAPVDSRKAPNIPENSRTPGTYGPGE